MTINKTIKNLQQIRFIFWILNFSNSVQKRRNLSCVEANSDDVSWFFSELVVSLQYQVSFRLFSNVSYVVYISKNYVSIKSVFKVWNGPLSDSKVELLQ